MASPITVELKAVAGEFMAKMGEARAEVAKLDHESKGHVQKFSAAGKMALLGLGGAAVAVGGMSLELADTWEKAHARLEQSVKNTGSSLGQWKTQLDHVQAATEKWGYTNAQTQQALGTLVTGTGNVGKSMDLMSTAADLARFKNIDLNDAAFMVTRALQGNSKVLKQLGIDLPVNAKGAESLKVAQNNLRLATETYQAQVDRVHAKHKVTAADLASLKIAHDRLAFAQSQVNQATHAHTIILDALNKKLHGQADAYTESFSGKLATLKARLEDVGVKIGMWLVPKIELLADVTMKVIGWLGKHKTMAEVLGVAIGVVLVGAITAYLATLAIAAVQSVISFGKMLVAGATWAASTVSEVVATATTWAIQMGLMDASAVASAGALLLAWAPIILALAAIGIAAYELYKHWDAVWSFIKRVVSDAVGFVQSHMDEIGVALMVITGPIGLVVGSAILLWHHWRDVWNGIRDVTVAGVRDVVTIFDDVVRIAIWPLKQEIRGLEAVWGAVWRGMGQVLEAIWNDMIEPVVQAIEDAVGSVTGAVDSIGHMLSHLPGAGILHKLHIPGFASGVQNFSGGLAVVGERGPELVELPGGSNVIPNGGRGRGGSGGGEVHVHFHGPVYGADADQLAIGVRNSLLRYNRRTGSTGVA